MTIPDMSRNSLVKQVSLTREARVVDFGRILVTFWSFDCFYTVSYVSYLRLTANEDCRVALCSGKCSFLYL